MLRAGLSPGDAPPARGRGGPAARAARALSRPAAAVLLAGTLLSAGSQAPDRSQADALDQRAAARIRDLQREADELASRERTLIGELRRLEVERDLRAAELTRRTRDLDDVQAALDDTAARIQALEQAAASQLPDLSARMVEIYKMGNAGYLRLLLDVDDLRSMGRAYRFVSGLQGIDRRRMAEHRQTLADLRKAQSALEQKRVEASRAEEAVGHAREVAERAVAARENLIRQVDARRDLAAQYVGELSAARQALQRTLDEAARGAPAGSGGTVVLPIRPFRGDLDWPAAGRLVGSFGRQVDRRFHTSTVSNGVRIAAEASNPVAAIHEGAVVFASAFTGFGKLVIVDHGGMAFSLYGYLGDIDVTTGERVARGQTLGSVGQGLDGDPGLYFELRIDGKPVDPLQWLRQK